MSDSTSELKFNWPGFPAIPPCIADDFQFEDLNVWRESERKPVHLAYWRYFSKLETAAPVFEGRADGVGHFVGCENPVSEVVALVALFRVLPKWREPKTWDELRPIANADSVFMGGKPWTAEQFEEACYEALRRLAVDGVQDENGDNPELEALEEAWCNRAKPAGRKATHRTTDAKRVMEALNISTDRAYKILRWGTGKLENRVKLAGAFAHDPERHTPESWELKSGSSWGGARRTFGEYCFKGAPHDTPVLAVVRGLLEQGTLSVNPTFEELAYSVKPTGTNAADLVDLWSAYKTWRTMPLATTHQEA